MTEYILCFILFCIGLYAVVIKRHIIKIIIGIGIMEYAVNLLFILIGYKHGAGFPFIEENMKVMAGVSMVDPLPQAIVMISIIINLTVVAIMVALAVRIYEKYGTFDITKIKRLKG
ncbi:MAG: sodium:proton antiporter [Elusimicrobiota bacterium]